MGAAEEKSAEAEGSGRVCVPMVRGECSLRIYVDPDVNVQVVWDRGHAECWVGCGQSLLVS